MRKLLLIILGVLTYTTINAQNINTIVGSLGDGISAINTSIKNPYGTAVDGLGNIYIADAGNHRIRKVTASNGIISTVVGNGTAGYGGDGDAATSASLNNPTGIALDSSGNIYISDAGNNRIRKVTASTGIISTIAGNGTAGYGCDGSSALLASLSSISLTVDGLGNIYIVDYSNHKIRKVIASTGIISTVAGNGMLGNGGDGNTATSASLKYPTGVAVDGLGNIYIADADNNRIRKVTASTGIISTIAGNGTFGNGGDGGAATLASLSHPSGVALDDSGNIYIADAYNNRTRKVTASTGIISTIAGNGTAAYGGDGSAATIANLYRPIGVAVDGFKNIYIVDAGNIRIRKITASTGIIITVAGNGTAGYGGDGSLSTLANLQNPVEVVVDVSGNIYIADAYNNRIRKVTASTGIISTIAGNGIQGYGGDGDSATSANLNAPSGITVDNSGNVFIADRNNHRIRKVTASTGIISTIAGNGTADYGGDGSAATSANLDNPIGVAVDGSGNIYIADRNNHRIRKVIASTGIISTLAGGGTASSLGDGSAATSARLSNPGGVAVDSSGNIYIADSYNNRIRKVTASTGIISTIAGSITGGAYGGDGSAATSAYLNNPQGVALDFSGNIYIADYENNRIRKVTASTGIISTIAGNGIQGYGGDGNAATSAKLNYPNGIAVDGSGNIYIADQGNNRIRLVNYTIVNNFISNSQTICAGSAPASLTGRTPIGITNSNTYSWLSSTTNATTGFTAIPSTNTINYSPGILTQNTWFRRYVVSGNFKDTSAAIAIKVNNAIGNNSIISSAQTICSGSTPGTITAITAAGGNGTTYNYKWLKSTTSSIAGFANAGGNDSTQNFTSGALTQNTWFKRRVSSGVCNADTTAALLVTIKPTSTSTNIISICPNLLPFIWNGRTYNSNRTDTVYLTNSVGCDSITILKLTIKSNSTSTSIVNVCPSSLPYTWNSRTYNSNRTDTVYLSNSVGCDSITILKLTVKPISTSTNNISICPTSLPFIWNGRTYNANTTDTFYLTNSVGCDSITILKLTIKSTSASTSIISICPSALPYTWNSRTYNSNRTDTIYLTNSVGCDSITILKLTIKPTSASTSIISICPSALPYTWNGRIYNTSVTDTVILTNAIGCDSITILKLTVKPTSTSTNNISICPSSLPYNWNNLIFNSAGTQTKTGLVNSVGCDSSATLNLTVKSTITSTNNLNICSSALPYTWNGLIFNAAGTQTKTGFTNSVGCDSSATLNLTVKSTSTSTNNIGICPSSLPYTWNNLIFNTAGTQTKTGLTNSVGCDSSATLNLTVNAIPTTSNITGLTNIARLDTTSYSVTGTSGSVFNWVTTKGLVQTGANTNQIQVKWNAIGMDTLKVTETSNQGCVGTQKTLLVNIGPATGMNEINTSNSIIVYPNPFNETIFISLLNNSGLNKAILFDLLGKEVLTTNKSEIDVKELKSGVYLIMVIDNNGNSYSQKLVKY